MPRHLADPANDAPQPLSLWLQRICAVARQPAALSQVLQSLPVGVLPEPPQAAPEAAYGRLQLLREGRAEVMHAGWRLGAYAEPHDHGQATGAVLVLCGSFREQAFQLRAGELVPCAVHEHTAGSVMVVSAGLVHSLEALTEGSTLHVYTPPVTRMRVYDRAAREVLELADEHGAWLPRSAQHVRARWSFLEASRGQH